jgi:hypothetical protein
VHGTEFWYTLPEGATGDFFDLDVTLANPTATAAPIAVDFLTEGGGSVPLVVERTQSWDARGSGGHGGTAVTPSTRWLYAEGAQGYFDTFVLLTNDDSAPVDVTVPGHARHTIHTGTIPALRDRSFGIDISAPRPIGADIQVLNYQPIAVEKAMYWNAEGVTWAAGTNVTAVPLPPPTP